MSSTAWDDEVNRYRLGSAYKRMSVAQTPTTTTSMGSAFRNPQPIVQNTIEVDEESFDDEEDELRPATIPPTPPLQPTQIQHRESLVDPESLLPQPEPEKDIDPDEQWVELISTTDVNYTLYYNKHTKETTFIRPKCLIDDDDDVGTALEFRYPNTEMSHHDKIRFHLDQVTKHVETSIQLSSHATSQGDAVTQEALRTLKVGLQQVYSTIRAAPEPDAKSNILEYLLGREQFTWDFNTDNKQCQYYRACSTRTNHGDLLYQNWHMPQYLSVQPLLPGASRVRLQISLPQSELGDAKTTFHTRRTLIEVKLNELVSSIIQKAYMKLFKTTPTNEMSQLYVLKAVGYNDYFTHDQEIGVYAYIRKCMRDLQDPEVLLVKKPEPTAAGTITPKRLEDARFFHDQYQESINPEIELLEKHTYADLIDIQSLPHEELSRLEFYPQTAIQVPWHVQIIGAENISSESLPRLQQFSPSEIVGLYIKSVLIHGAIELPWNYETSTSPDINETISFHEVLPGNSQTIIANLPRETRVGYVLMARRAATDGTSPANNKTQQQDDEEKSDKVKGDVPLAWTVNNIINFQGEMLTGTIAHSLWPLPREATHKKAANQRKRDVDPQWLARSCNIDNYTTPGPNTPQPVKLYIKYPTFQRPVVAPLVPLYIEPNIRVVGTELQRSLDKHHSSLLLRAITSDPLFEFTHEVKALLWNSRHYLTDVPGALPKILQCVDWTRIDMKNEMYRLLSLWSVPSASPIDAIELLDVKYADYQIREYAINILRFLNDEDLQLYALQLVQCLKYEPYHDSPLSRFLIERSIASPYQIGHSVYWHLKAEIHDPQYCERFTCIMEELLSNIGIMVDELYKQAILVHKFQQVADQIIRCKRQYDMTDEDTTLRYHDLLRQINNDVVSKWEKFQIPLNPRWEAKGLIIEKCRFMSSKMVPLWLVFENADPDGPPIYLIFKSGDDLRQDLLTLQILRVMDRMWLQHGLDMRLKPYNVIATGVNEHGEGVGMIEVVLNSATTSDIQVKYGGGARGALKLDPLDNFIRENNPVNEMLLNSSVQVDTVIGGESDASGTKRPLSKYTAAVDNFVRSCAGYCVATFVLGIGDRHNGNIMVTKSGHLFHIDFGHFLGNFKKKFGVNRERAAFVFTPEMAFVMGGKDYKNSEIFKHFKIITSKSFRILREYASLLESLFVLMVVAGMPELAKEKDIHYLRDKLYLDTDAKTAQKELLDELKKSLDSTYRRFDNYIHNLKHN